MYIYTAFETSPNAIGENVNSVLSYTDNVILFNQREPSYNSPTEANPELGFRHPATICAGAVTRVIIIKSQVSIDVPSCVSGV